MLNDLSHWEVRFVARGGRGGVNVGVHLAVIKSPEDGLQVVIRAIDGQLGGRGGGILPPGEDS